MCGKRGILQSLEMQLWRMFEAIKSEQVKNHERNWRPPTRVCGKKCVENVLKTQV